MGKHAPYRRANDPVWAIFHLIAQVGRFQATRVIRVMIIIFLIQALARDLQPAGIDHDHKIAQTG